ncbi:head maturation protease, ClpP-related [Clostridium sp. UBA4395]|uniref:head maturation protease, ClpP-related n=1 Tax=Clostridium sp. UBA4395 TaxID=1946360 RepID=UPI0032175310
MKEDKKFWKIEAKLGTKKADLYIYHEINSYHFEGVTDSADSIHKELSELGDIDVLNIYIDSPGGMVTTGMAIYEQLKRKSQECKIVAHIDGLAASISSVIPLAADEVIMARNAFYMIHKASIGIYANADELEKKIELLKKMDNKIKNIYLDKANGKLDESTLDSWLNSGDTWLTAEEALKYGLVDSISDEIKATAKYDNEVLGHYKNVPKAFFNAKNQENNYKTEEKPVMDEATKAMIARINAKKQDWNL